MLKNLSLFPPVFLAPMAGVTDTPSREIAQLFNPGLVVSEMIASSEQNKEYFERTVRSNLSYKRKSDSRCPTAIQIAGNEKDWMAYAAKVIYNEGGDLIDINMGCPAKKIVGKLAGSALMREPLTALKLIESVVEASDLPVTLKMRLGWDQENINAKEIAKGAEQCGIQMITVHARTRNQFFKGKAQWEKIREIKDEISIPVIVNGDIVDMRSAQLALNASRADGVMIGRGALGKPWLIQDISYQIYNAHGVKLNNFVSLDKLITSHLGRILSFYGKENGVNIFRKHLAGYLNSLPVDKKVKRSLMTEISSIELEKKIESLFCQKKIKVTH